MKKAVFCNGWSSSSSEYFQIIWICWKTLPNSLSNMDSDMPSHLKNNTYHQSLDNKQEYASPRCVRRPPCCKKVWRSPVLRTGLVDPVWCLRKVDPRYSWPDHGTFVWRSADELKRPHNLRELTQKVFQKFWRNNLLLFNLCYFSKRLICQDFQKTFMKSNKYNIWLIGPAFRCASSFWARNDHSFSD